MEAMAMDLIQQFGPAVRLASLPLLVSIIPLLMLAFTGIPGRTVLEVETRLAMRRERRRREMNAKTIHRTVGIPAISGDEITVPA